MSDCPVCQKHKDLGPFVGEAIADHGGWILSHFPFLTTDRATRGHLLIETRRHITELGDLTHTEATALGELLRAGASALKAQLKAEHVYVFRINDKVPHLHFHLVPRYAGTPREHWGPKIMEWADRPTVNRNEIQELSRQLKAALTP